MEFHFSAEPPEEIKKAIAEQVDQEQAVYEASRLELERLFHDLSADQLSILKRLVNSIVANQLAGPYWEGVLSAYLMLKHNVCPGCGRNHDEEAAKFLAAEARKQTTISPSGDLEVEGQLVLPEMISPEEYNELCVKYNVLPDEHSIPGPMAPVKCMGCGLDYVSLADRMIKPPGIAGCHGCQSKSAWG